ncbi:MAG: TonB family protein [Gallionella sp.]|nr:TonB family protein [Gallionella sp.]
MSSLASPSALTIVNPADLPLRDRSLIVASVVLVHALLLWFLATMPSLSKSAPHEMSVSIVTMPSSPQVAPAEPEPKPEPVVKPKPVEPRRVQPTPEIATPVASVETPASTAQTSSAPPQPVNASPGLPDREPDYQAAYLNNPVPAYPMVARRMGWQGRVVLNVEVLASGLPGQVKLHQSSGHDVLDNAAMQAVRGWRFVAARQGGQMISKWFLVPIPFILKED